MEFTIDDNPAVNEQEERIVIKSKQILEDLPDGKLITYNNLAGLLKCTPRTLKTYAYALEEYRSLAKVVKRDGTKVRKCLFGNKRTIKAWNEKNTQ